MPLLPPVVVGPLSVCSSKVRVQGQLTGSTVDVLAGGVRVGGGAAQSADQFFALDRPLSLRGGVEVTARQTIGQDSSPPSPAAVKVQGEGPVGHVGFPLVPYVGAECVWLDGMVPGAAVQVRVAGGVVGEADADDGSCVVGLRKPLTASDELVARQTACGRPGPDSITKPDPAPARLPPPYLSLHACQTIAEVRYVVRGGHLTVTRRDRSGNVSPATACCPADGFPWRFDPALDPDDAIFAQLELPRGGASSPEWSEAVRDEPLPPPAIVPPVCEGDVRVHVEGLVPGTRFSLLQDGSSLGDGEAPAPSVDVQVSGLEAGRSIAVSYSACDQTGISEAVTVEAGGGDLPTPVIKERLYECAAVIRVNDVRAGAWVQLMSARLGAPIGEQRVASEEFVDIRVAPRLSVDDEIWAVQTGCGRTVESARRRVEKFPGVNAPSISGPVREWALLVDVSGVVPGARVDVHVGPTWLGTMYAPTSSVSVPLSGLPGVQAGDVVTARQVMCDGASPPGQATVGRWPPTVVLDAAPPVIEAGQSVKLTWHTTGADTIVLEPGRIDGLAATGSRTEQPVQDTLYVMTATNSGGSVSDSAHVGVRHSVQTAEESVQLFRETIFAGPTPYRGRFPVIGTVSGGVLLAIRNSWTDYLLFPKFAEGFGTDDCADPAAVIAVASGAIIDRTGLMSIYGTLPPLPVDIVACVRAVGRPDWVPIVIAYSFTS